MSKNRENEFENLFKRAAENYPINSSNTDWNAVLAGLEEDKNDKKGFFLLNKKYVLFIGLILLVAIVSSLITGLIVWNSSSNKKINKLENVSRINIQQNNATERKIAAEVYEKVMHEIANKHNTSATKSNIQVIQSSKSNQLLDQKNSAMLPIAESKEKNANSNEINNIQNKSVSNIPPSIEAIKANQGISENESVVISKIPIDSSEKIKSEKTKTTSSDKKDISNNAAQSTVVKIKSDSKYMYGGLLFAKDKSSIKLEPNKGSGYSLAFMLGYHFIGLGIINAKGF